MKGLLASHLVDCAPDTVTHSDIDAVVQVQNGVYPVIKANDEPAGAGVYVGDGGKLHGNAAVDAGLAIVVQGGAA
jgi:hypothetical protein